MSYSRTRSGLGFTPEEEKLLLSTVQSETDEQKKLDEMLEILRRQDQLKMITAVAAIGGALYSLARIGELVAALRAKRGVNL